MRIVELINKSIYIVLVGILVFLISGCGSSPESEEWKTKSITETGTVIGIPRGNVLVGTPRELPGCVRVRIVDTLGEGIDCRVVVIDGSGRIHIGDKTAKFLLGTTCRSTSLVFSDMKLTDIKEMCFQYRHIANR